MNIIMLIGIGVSIILMLATVFFWSRAMAMEDASADFDAIHSLILGIRQQIGRHKDASITTEDVECDVSDKIQAARSTFVRYVNTSRWNNRMSWYCVTLSIGILLLSILLNAYVEVERQEAYKQGVVESMQKAQKAVQEALDGK